MYAGCHPVTKEGHLTLSWNGRRGWERVGEEFLEDLVPPLKLGAQIKVKHVKKENQADQPTCMRVLGAGVGAVTSTVGSRRGEEGRWAGLCVLCYGHRVFVQKAIKGCSSSPPYPQGYVLRPHMDARNPKYYQTLYIVFFLMHTHR